MVWTRRPPGPGAPRPRLSGTYARKKNLRGQLRDPGSIPGSSTILRSGKPSGGLLLTKLHHKDAVR